MRFSDSDCGGFASSEQTDYGLLKKGGLYESACHDERTGGMG